MSSKSSGKSESHIDLIESPPQTIGGILLRLGPGLVIAGSIVGSGELIATTATGAQAGFWLLWLIIIGCVIKVFVQVEFGRYSIATGQGTLEGLSQVPGPRVAGRGNWLVWYWVLMFAASLAQLGGIVGGVGQALAISVPITESGRLYNEQMDLETRYLVARAELQNEERKTGTPNPPRLNSLRKEIAELGPQLVKLRLLETREQLKRADDDSSAQTQALAAAAAIAAQRAKEHPDQPEKVFFSQKEYADGTPQVEIDADQLLAGIGMRKSIDDKLWATVIAVLTSILLVIGRYGLIQTFSTCMVAAFTLITIINLIALQQYGEWAVTFADLSKGFSFGLPPNNDEALSTALRAFGIIGVGASELIAYPYWCLEKGYARFTGPLDKSQAWADRARGWLRVMRWDAWCSMVVYTFATVAFYLLGAAILGRIRLQPQGSEMIRTLSLMYAPVFGEFTQMLFLFGAFAVLYSTFFVANAGQARMCADAMQVTGLARKTPAVFRANVRWLSGLFPMICLAVYWIVAAPKELVLFSGLMQAMMLPMLSFAALYFRYKRSDIRIVPGRLWDAFLLISSLGMLITGSWAGYTELAKYLGW